MLPRALYNPDLEPSFPLVITCNSLQQEKDLYTDWWNHDKVATYILTSHLSPTVPGTLPIANSQLGQWQSARTIYTTLKNNYGAEDYSAVMAIKLQLCRLRCLPACGGVHVLDYISTWCVLYNQIEAAGYPPMARQTVTMFIDGLPTNIVSYITLYNNIMVSLNEPNDSLLPNIHHLFDHITRIDGNVNQSQLLHHDSRTNQMINQPVITLSSATTSIPAVTENTTGTVHKCNNCGQIGHTNETCFQPGGKMEGCQEEYLANQPIKTQAHLASAEEVHEKEITIDTVDKLVLTEEFAAMLLTHTNDIDFASYPFCQQTFHLMKKT